MEKRTRSLKWQMVGTMLVCWLVPVALVLGVMGWYLSDSLGQQAAENLTEQLTVNTRLCADRLDSAISSSRTASSDTTIKDAWAQYRLDGSWPALYRSGQVFLEGQYRTDVRFRFAVFTFSADPERMRLFTYNQAQGVRYDAFQDYWDRDAEAVAELAAGLDTSLGFLRREGGLYLVRNIMSAQYRPIGTLVLALNPDYYFENLTLLPWCSDVTVYLAGQPLILTGQVQPPPEAVEPTDLRAALRPGGGAGSVLLAQAVNREYDLAAVAKVDTASLVSQFAGYRSILAVLLLLLAPMLLFVLYYFQRKVSQPVQAMMDGAREIEGGALGHQLSYKANSREFQYLMDSFNHMSGQLRYQFDRLYQEEIALRDARIKALQSHINPHFLNNTLEIINWEARMSGDAKVSKMIEALSTVLDAAIDRKKSPEVTLAEEMVYVNAYLYIIDQRFGKRLGVVQDISEETLSLTVPRLILQPVIENAVEHGFGPAGTGEIVIRSRMRDGLLLIDVENDGVMTDEDQTHIRRLLAPDYDSSRESAGNLGISNVNQRLRILYGGPSGLQIGFNHGKVVARLTIKPKEV